MVLNFSVPCYTLVLPNGIEYVAVVLCIPVVLFHLCCRLRYAWQRGGGLGCDPWVVCGLIGICVTTEKCRFMILLGESVLLKWCRSRSWRLFRSIATCMG